MTAARSIWHLDGQNADRELVVTLPIKVISESNWRGHYMARHHRTKGQKQVVGLALGAALSLHGPPGFPCTVTLVRLIGSGGRMLDDDNNVGGFKAIRDAVAKCLGVDDADPRVTWTCDQRREKAWGVEVRIGRARAQSPESPKLVPAEVPPPEPQASPQPAEAPASPGTRRRTSTKRRRSHPPAPGCKA